MPEGMSPYVKYVRLIPKCSKISKLEIQRNFHGSQDVNDFKFILWGSFVSRNRLVLWRGERFFRTDWTSQSWRGSSSGALGRLHAVKALNNRCES